MTYQIKVAGTEHSFACADGETVLDAAQRAGFEVPYSCKKGICGSCRGAVVEGQVDCTGAREGLSDAERSSGFVLYCRAKPQSDLVVAPTSIRRADPATRRVVKARVYRVSQPALDVTQLQLRFPAGVKVKFRAGQYLQVVFGGGERRSFSMANPPSASDSAVLHIRHVEGGCFSGTVLPTLKPGDQLDVELPYGDFYLRDDCDKAIIFVASGTGFAPIHSIVEHALSRNVQRPMHFYWGARRLADLYALDVPRRWVEKHPGFQFIPVLSAPANEDGWTGRTGFVHQAVMDDHPTLEHMQVYACGAPAMTSAARQDFTSMRALPASQFFCDAFVAGPAS